MPELVWTVKLENEQAILQHIETVKKAAQSSGGGGSSSGGSGGGVNSGFIPFPTTTEIEQKSKESRQALQREFQVWNQNRRQLLAGMQPIPEQEQKRLMGLPDIDFKKWATVEGEKVKQAMAAARKAAGAAMGGEMGLGTSIGASVGEGLPFMVGMPLMMARALSRVMTAFGGALPFIGGAAIAGGAGYAAFNEFYTKRRESEVGTGGRLLRSGLTPNDFNASGSNIPEPGSVREFLQAPGFLNSYYQGIQARKGAAALSSVTPGGQPDMATAKLFNDVTQLRKIDAESLANELAQETAGLSASDVPKFQARILANEKEQQEALKGKRRIVTGMSNIQAGMVSFPTPTFRQETDEEYQARLQTIKNNRSDIIRDIGLGRMAYQRGGFDIGFSRAGEAGAISGGMAASEQSIATAEKEKELEASRKLALARFEQDPSSRAEQLNEASRQREEAATKRIDDDKRNADEQLANRRKEYEDAQAARMALWESTKTGPNANRYRDLADFESGPNADKDARNALSKVTKAQERLAEATETASRYTDANVTAQKTHISTVEKNIRLTTNEVALKERYLQDVDLAAMESGSKIGALETRAGRRGTTGLSRTGFGVSSLEERSAELGREIASLQDIGGQSVHVRALQAEQRVVGERLTNARIESGMMFGRPLGESLSERETARGEARQIERGARRLDNGDERAMNEVRKQFRDQFGREGSVEEIQKAAQELAKSLRDAARSIRKDNALAGGDEDSATNRAGLTARDTTFRPAFQPRSRNSLGEIVVESR